MTPQEVWTSQCEVAREILADDGIESALSYLIGGKLLDFLQLADDYPEWREAIPKFVAEIKDIFGAWHIAEYLNSPCQRGAAVHAGGEETHQFFSFQPADEMDLLGHARDAMLLAWARRLLLDNAD